MVFPGFSLYNKKSCIVDTDRKQLPGVQVFCDGRTTLFYEKGKETDCGIFGMEAVTQNYRRTRNTGKDGKFALRIALNAFLRAEFRQESRRI